MAAHPYSLRSRLNSQNASVKTTPTNPPLPRAGSRSPRKTNNATSLSLHRVIGTTTSNPSGISSHSPSNTYAYCAGSAAVLAKVGPDGKTTQKFYRARPLASSINPCISFYDQGTPTSTPSKRKPVMPGRSNVYATPTRSPMRSRWEEEPSVTWTARERIKAASCVSLSHDGRLLAVGETGYSPRVLIFSTAEDGPFDQPLSIMAEHSFGVRAVAFSPDSRYLATLGDANDGFLLVWAVNPKTGAVSLHSTNKCKVDVRDMTWVGNTVVTVGVRHVKIWRVVELPRLSPSKHGRLRIESDAYASPAPTPLAGRNVLLGPLVDCTFSCVSSISDTEAVVCSDTGHICLLDDTGGAQDLRIAKHLKKPLSSISHSSERERVNIAADGGLLHSETIDDLRRVARPAKNSSTDTRSPNSKIVPAKFDTPRDSQIKATEKMKTLIAMAPLSEMVIGIDIECNILAMNCSDSTKSEAQHVMAHADPVQGLQLLPPGCLRGCFYTWTARGNVKFWDSGGTMVRSCEVKLELPSQEEEGGSNDLVTVHYVSSHDYFVSGDQVGVLTLTKADNWTIVQQIRAHGAQVNKIVSCIVKGDTLLATSGCDRMVQLFQTSEESVELLQTLDDHIGSVSQVLFTNDGERLLSASSDRTVVIRDRIARNVNGRESSAYLPARVVTLKSSPLSVALLPGQDYTLVVSTMDRHVLKMDILTGSISDSFKVADPENEDTVTLQSISLTLPEPGVATQLLIGYSSTDKSIRVYDFDKNILLTRESGHTEGVSDVALLENASTENFLTERNVISTGLDGTVMIWKLKMLPPQALATPLRETSQGQTLSASEFIPRKISQASLPPLRKVLTKMDIESFTRVDPISGSPIAIRDPSPARLRRKASRLAMAANKIPEHEVPVLPAAQTSVRPESIDRTGSPSPPPAWKSTRPQKQRSKTDPSDTEFVGQSQSPPSNAAPTPRTPSHRNRPNNGRLRRPPSVPTDLRAQAMQQARRKSMGNINDFGSMSIASDQLCRSLRTFRKRLLTVQGQIDLQEVKEELRETLGVVEEKTRHGGMQQDSDQCRYANKAARCDVDHLTLMLERTSMNGSSTLSESSR